MRTRSVVGVFMVAMLPQLAGCSASLRQTWRPLTGAQVLATEHPDEVRLTLVPSSGSCRRLCRDLGGATRILMSRPEPAGDSLRGLVSLLTDRWEPVSIPWTDITGIERHGVERQAPDTFGTGAAGAPAPPLPLVPGDHVRFWTRSGGDEPITGVVASLDPLSGLLTVARAQSSPWSVPLESVSRIEVSDGQTSNADRGLLAGAAGGAAVGMVIGALTSLRVSYSLCVFACSKSEFRTEDLGPNVRNGALRGAAAGGLLGVLVGALSHRERWNQVPLVHGPVALMPSLDGRIGFTARFAF